MKAGELCSRTVVTANRDESVIDVARRMAEHDVGSVVVVDEAARPIGVVTDRDLVTRALARGEPIAGVVEDVMDAGLVTAREDDEVDTVLAKLRHRAVRRVPIIGAEGCLIGILTLDDIIGWISEELRDAAVLIERQGREVTRSESAEPSRRYHS
jgi:CBS domain-containing protein